uniref:RNase H type-1 domain-containing protein n=1 Tax=Arion vulgaris TaxID=1028688 RepID=A0A0B7A5H5_9EUPU
MSLLSKKSEFVLHWILAHCSVARNDKSDKLARGRGSIIQPHTTQSFIEAKTLLKQSRKIMWRKTTGGYNRTTTTKLELRGRTGK